MRDPRSGFAKGFCNRFWSIDVSVAARALGLALCSACGGAAASSTNGARSAPSAPAAQAPAAQAPAAEAPPAAAGPSVLRYAAPAGCPGVDGYLGHVRSRSTRLNLEASAAAANIDAVDVRIEPEADGRGWLGRVSIAGPVALEREVRGDRCEDVVAALALITVLRLEGADASAVARASAPSTSGSATAPAGSAASDAEAPSPERGSTAESPTASEAASSGSAERAAPGEPPSAPDAAASAPTEPSPAEPSAPAEPSVPSEPSEPSDPERTARPEPEPSAAPDVAEPAPPRDPRAGSDRGADVGSEAVALPRSSEPEPPESLSRAGEIVETPAEAEPSFDEPAEPAPASSPWRWPHTSAALAAHVGYAMVPSHAVRAALDAELRLGEGGATWLSSLSLAYARGNDTADPGDFGLTLLTAELALCPPAFVNEPSVWLSACGSVRGGALHLAFTRPLPGLDAPDVWRPWVALGPSLRVGVPISERWALRGLAELAVQLVRDTFAVRVEAPDSPSRETLPLYRPEAVSLELSAGVSYSF